MPAHRFAYALLLASAACAVPERPDRPGDTSHERGVRIIQQTCDADAECPPTYACQMAVAHGTTVSYCLSYGPGPSGGSCPDGLVLVIDDDDAFCAPPCSDDRECPTAHRCEDRETASICLPHA